RAAVRAAGFGGAKLQRSGGEEIPPLPFFCLFKSPQVSQKIHSIFKRNTINFYNIKPQECDFKALNSFFGRRLCSTGTFLWFF
ncbi:MAG: hypothetical protein JW803_00415, partial [Endomicrobiales bacterium]|nr:hypothetical protein [Endomicrobiales bacterium]